VTIPYFGPNTIYCGDCKEVMAKFPNECVDLIYADPPFFSNKSYEVLWKDGYEKRAFEDRWKGGIENYVLWMKEKLEHCYRVIKKNRLDVSSLRLARSSSPSCSNGANLW